MRMIIDNISKREAKEMIERQYGVTMWEVLNGERVTHPAGSISVRLFNTDMAVEAPPQHIIDMTKEVLTQNREILEMNATMLKFLAAMPVIHGGPGKEGNSD